MKFRWFTADRKASCVLFLFTLILFTHICPSRFATVTALTCCNNNVISSTKHTKTIIIFLALTWTVGSLENTGLFWFGESIIWDHNSAGHWAAADDECDAAAEKCQLWDHVTRDVISALVRWARLHIST